MPSGFSGAYFIDEDVAGEGLDPCVERGSSDLTGRGTGGVGVLLSRYIPNGTHPVTFRLRSFIIHLPSPGWISTDPEVIPTPSPPVYKP